MRLLTFLSVLVLAFGLAGCNDHNNHTDYTHYEPYTKTGLYLNILPPGQSPQGVNPLTGDPASPYFQDQSKMYEALEYAQKGLQTSELAPSYFKQEKFNPPSNFPNKKTISDSGAGLTANIGRDQNHGVPHIYGKNRADVMFGIGYATAHDRLFLLDVLRHYGAGTLSSFIGPSLSGFNAKSIDTSAARTSGYSKAELKAQVQDAVRRAGPAGKRVLQDVNNFLAGINYYIQQVKAGKADKPLPYALLPLNKFTKSDVVAVVTLVEARFGTGGGGEIGDSELLSGIDGRFSNMDNAKKCELWHDILQARDPDRPVTSTKTFDTQSPRNVDLQACPLDPSFATQYPGAVVLDPGSFSTGGTSVHFENCAEPGSGGGGGLPQCPGNDSQANSQTAALHFRKALHPGSDSLQQLAALESTGVTTPGHATRVPFRSASFAGKGARAKRQIVATLGKTHTLLSKGIEGLKNRSLMSNALLVGAKHTASGHPVAVFGPQVGYFEPEILMEFEAHGGGIDTRGVAFPGLPYVVIGRGIDFAWSATSAETDITDTRVLKLCKNGQGYLYDGQCKDFYHRVDTWTSTPLPAPFGPGGPPQKVTRTILRAPSYGPVVGYATVDGRKVAIAKQRSTFLHELDSAVGFMKMDENRAHDPKSFQKIMNTTTGTFNWFYIDSQHIAYVMAGLMPERSSQIYPYLPQWGTGQYDWKQKMTGELTSKWSESNFLPFEAHPRAIDPDRGYLTSWNNAQAPGFRASDSTHSWGPVQRVEMLNARLQAAMKQGPITPGELVQVMEDGGFTDLRGQEVLPYALKILKKGSLDSNQKQAVKLLSDWVKGGDYPGLGAWRRDRNQDGQYDDRAAVVLMDAWYPRMIDEAMPQLVKLENTSNGNVMPIGRDNSPGAKGSAYQSGYYGYLQRSFKKVLGTANHPYNVLQCADDTLQGCRQALLTSLDKALSKLGGISSKANWDGSTLYGEPVEKRDQIEFSGVGLAQADPMTWVNRPTWQQVVQPTTKRTLK